MSVPTAMRKPLRKLSCGDVDDIHPRVTTAATHAIVTNVEKRNLENASNARLISTTPNVPVQSRAASCVSPATGG